MDIVFFFYSQLFKLIETSYFLKTSILTNKAPLVLIFFPGDCILLAKLFYNLSIKGEKLPIRLIYFTNVVKVIDFEPIKIFQSSVILKNKAETKTNLRRVLLN